MSGGTGDVASHPFPLTDLGAALARGAADGQAALVVMIRDEQVLLVAVRPYDLAPSDVTETCRSLFELLGTEGRGPAVLVSVNPELGTEPEALTAAWPGVATVFAEAGASLIAWLMVRDDKTHIIGMIDDERPA